MDAQKLKSMVKQRKVDMELVTSTDIIRMRDQMPLSELKEITRKTKEKFRYVCYHEIFKTMGYMPAYNGKWFKPKTI